MFISVFLVLFVIAEIGFFIADKFILSFFILLGSLIFAFFFVPEVGAYIATHGYMSILTELLPIYLVIGVGVAVVKWFLFVFKKAGKVAECRERARKNDHTSRHQLVEYWNNYYYMYGNVYSAGVSLTNDEEFLELFTPVAKREVDRITFWVLQWPIVVVATILEDFLIKLGKHVASLFDSLFNGLSKKIIGNSLKGL